MCPEKVIVQLIIVTKYLIAVVKICTLSILAHGIFQKVNPPVSDPMERLPHGLHLDVATDKNLDRKYGLSPGTTTECLPGNWVQS